VPLSGSVFCLWYRIEREYSVSQSPLALICHDFHRANCRWLHLHLHSRETSPHHFHRALFVVFPYPVFAIKRRKITTWTRRRGNGGDNIDPGKRVRRKAERQEWYNGDHLIFAKRRTCAAETFQKTSSFARLSCLVSSIAPEYMANCIVTVAVLRKGK